MLKSKKQPQPNKNKVTKQRMKIKTEYSLPFRHLTSNTFHHSPYKKKNYIRVWKEHFSDIWEYLTRLHKPSSNLFSWIRAACCAQVNVHRQLLDLQITPHLRTTRQKHSPGESGAVGRMSKSALSQLMVQLLLLLSNVSFVYLCNIKLQKSLWTNDAH